MFDKIISYSIENKVVIGLLMIALILWGIFSLRQLPIDAVPDITNNQVQVMTLSPTLATQEVEQFITTPVELALQNIQQLVEIRSISRFGLSVVTVVFEEDMDIYLARQLVGEYLKTAEENIPEGFGSPELAPISTGLGEIYQYALHPAEGYDDQYSLSDLRSIQDWIVKRQLSGIKGVVEINTLGGHLKQYEVAVNPNALKALEISISDVFEAIQNSNENTGGAYIEKSPNTYYIRTNGIVKSLVDIGNIVITNRNGKPILVNDVAEVQFGKAPRYGAATRNGKEVISATVMMLKGENSAAVTSRIKTRIEQIKKSLPEGIVIEPYLVRDKLITTAMSTVKKNLLEGGLIVVFILVIMLGNWRAGLIVASVIPLAMLFAVSMMNVLGISANLMSLGAIDFGLIVDGAVIIVEAIIHRLHIKHAGKQLTASEMNKEVESASLEIRNSAAFGEIIILMVYIPILALVGIEGKMFRPMAQTVMLAIGGALILSLTYVPMMSAWFLSKHISSKKTIADRIIHFFQRFYTPILKLAMRFKAMVTISTLVLFIVSIMVFKNMGGEFIPTLEEGDFALHQILPPGSSLTQSVETSKVIQTILLEEFPEIEEIITKIGSAEIPTDPMPVETGDIIVVMKPKSEWVSASSRHEMFDKMEHVLLTIPGVAYEFSQPIQMRFNELMTGSRADIAIKLYGDDQAILFDKAKEAEKLIKKVAGVGTVKVEQTIGMPQIVVNFKYDKMAQYGLQVRQINQVIRAAFAGENAGVVYEGEQKYDLVVRLDESFRKDINSVRNLYVDLKDGTQVPLDAVADIELLDAPMQISRDNTKRRIVIGVNVGDTDVATLVNNIQTKLEKDILLPNGYYFTFGGQFENLQAANARLLIAVPLALALIFILLFFTFGSIPQALLIFTAIPLSAIGGIWALELRGMPFSISAGIGFIALFGVAVLNGIVLIGYFNQLKKEGMVNIKERITKGTKVRLRPVLMTAAVASLGFLPMALSTSGGAEVQRPLATVVIGGLITATFLTLIVLPVLYSWLANWDENRVRTNTSAKSIIVLLPLLFFTFLAKAQNKIISIDEAIEIAVKNHPSLKAAKLQTQQVEFLQNMPYSPGNTEVMYQGDGMFRENNQRVNQLAIVQNFEHPSINKASNAIIDERVKSSNIKEFITKNDLKLQVRKVYNQLQKKMAKEALFKEAIESYSIYYAQSETRVKLGATNAIEMLTLQSKIEEYRLLTRQLELEINGLKEQLKNVLRIAEEVEINRSFELLEYSNLTSSKTLEIQLMEQQVQYERSLVSLEKSKLKPGFTLSYAIQHYQEGGWLSGLQAGAKIPLFNRATRRKIEAQKLQIDVANSILDVKKIEINQELLIIKNRILVYKEGVSYYKTQIEIMNPEIQRISKLNYEAGEISYLELLNTLNLSLNNSVRYLEQIGEHNQAVVQYLYLSNQ